MKTYENWSSLPLFLYVFYCLWISYVFYCFMISAIWDLHLDQYQAELMIYKAKRGQNYWYSPKWKIHFAICFVHKIKKFSLFRLTFDRKRSRDCNGRSDFCILGVKISARLQRKKSWSGVAESVSVLRARQNLSRGLWGPPPPPPSAVRVKEIPMCHVQ